MARFITIDYNHPEFKGMIILCAACRRLLDQGEKAEVTSAESRKNGIWKTYFCKECYSKDVLVYQIRKRVSPEAIINEMRFQIQLSMEGFKMLKTKEFWKKQLEDLDFRNKQCFRKAQ